MSKRTRGRPEHRRPGTRSPSSRSDRPTSRPDPRPAAPEGNVPDPVAEAIGRTDANATRPQAGGSRTRVTAGQGTPAPVRTIHHRARAKPGSVLAERAATEYVYVAKDLRRIALVAALLIGILVVLWVVLVVMGLSPLY